MHVLLLALCTLLGVPSTPARVRILDAIEQATIDEREASLLVVFAWYESRFREHPEPVSWDARADVAHGPWQLWGAHGHDTLESQARAWLAQLHEGQRACPGSPLAPISGGCLVPAARRLGERREREAERLRAQAELDVAMKGSAP